MNEPFIINNGLDCHNIYIFYLLHTTQLRHELLGAIMVFNHIRDCLG